MLLIAVDTAVFIASHIVVNVFLIPSNIGVRNPTIAFQILLMVVEIASRAVDTAFLINSQAAMIYSLQFSHINIQGIVMI